MFKRKITFTIHTGLRLLISEYTSSLLLLCFEIWVLSNRLWSVARHVTELQIGLLIDCEDMSAGNKHC